MLKGIVGILLFGLAFVIAIAMVIVYFVYKGYRNLRDVQDDIINNTGKRFSRQEYIRYQRENRDKNPFGDDYFKSANTSSNNTSSGDNSKKSSGGFGFRRKEQPKSQQNENTTRRTTTSSGVTIIDSRDADEKRKIFDRNDGEYVEFEEV